MIALDREGCLLRPWRRGDAASLAENADNREVWLNLRDRFPHPYTRADAEGWIAHVEGQAPPTHLAIEVDGAAVGGIAIQLGSDIERCSAEIGYWLGEAYWGRGIVTAAVRAMTEHAFREFPLTRVFAVPFARNPASCRVLEKAGYLLEGTLRRSAIKDGQVLDQCLYARVLP